MWQNLGTFLASEEVKARNGWRSLSSDVNGEEN
jgi:hypothetical protein